MKKILVVAAHPDDEVLGMGGTIAKLTREGNEVYVLIVTDGSSSQYRGSNQLAQIIEDKKKETMACARILGVKEVMYGALPDMKLDTVPHICINKVIEDAVRYVQPEIVFTHFWGDVNIDHQQVYKSTLVAARPVMGQVVKELYCYRVPSSTEWTPCTAGTMFMPNVFVDIKDSANLKYNAFAEYRTELREYPHPRSIQHLKELDIARGLEFGQGPTETFVLLRRLV